ncbi:MAG: hypothetical protein IKD44_02435 [Lentisphaeria bacterium]|nr:hypothetical protein [Lentisphaeria bacterium]
MKKFTQEKNTWAFLREFKFLENMDKCDDEEAEFAPSSHDEEFRRLAAETVTPFDWRVRKGELRMLSQTENLTYGVVLPWDWSHSLFVPFSHSAHPASDQEFYSENQARGAFQQVFQVWNARTVNNTLLARSWAIDEISETDMNRLNLFLKNLWLGEELPQGLVDLSGLPLQEKDIRRKFISRELENFASLDAEDTAIDLWQNEFSENESSIFNSLKTGAVLELQAAAGKTFRSPLYVCSGQEFQFVDALELEAFEVVPAGQQIPGFTWFTEKLPAGCQKYQEVFMVHCQSGKLLGSGLIIPVKGGFEFNLLYDLGNADTPEIRTPADIQLIIRKK